MSRLTWIAIIAALAIPSIALTVVLATRPPPPPPPPGLGAPPPPGRHKPPAFPEEALESLRDELSLTEEQAESMRKIAAPARARLGRIDEELTVKEKRLGDLLRDDDVDLDEATRRMAEISKLRAERDSIVVITPIKLRRVLTAEQRSKVVGLGRRLGGPNPLGPPPPGALPQKPPPPPRGKGPHGGKGRHGAKGPHGGKRPPHSGR